MKGHLQEKAQWQSAFDELLKFGSEEVLKDELLQAKKIFFSKLGSTHEMREDLYEATSRSFLEWYLFDYQTWIFSKSPAVVFVSLEAGDETTNQWLNRSLFEHWSLYEVCEIHSHYLVLKDLLFGGTRKLSNDAEATDSKIWRVKRGQIIQARLFGLENPEWHFLTHLWIHPNEEKQRILKICARQSQKWSRHKQFLLECFEAVVRSHGLQNQIRAARSINWFYAELEKKYA